MAAAARLAAEGHPVALLARRADRLEAAAASIRAALPTATVSTHQFDVRDRAAVKAVVDAVVAAHGPVAWLFASADIVEPGRFVDQSLDRHRDQIEVNYLGTLHAVHAVVPSMVATGGGNLVLVSSGAGLFGIYGEQFARDRPTKPVWFLSGDLIVRANARFGTPAELVDVDVYRLDDS